MRGRRAAEWCALGVLVGAIPAVARAQVPAAPAAPALPAAPAVSAPAAPSLPAAPAAPGAPAAPSPSGGAKGAPPAAPAASAAGADVPAPTAPEDTELLLQGQVAEPAPEGLPATLPRELQHNAPNAALADKKGALTIEELVNAPVVSASRRKEGALSAPAFVIVITAKDLRDRGYTDMSQILDDLPGMDVMRAYGDVYVKSYWRGYRPGAGADPYLVMVDGVVYNSLFYGDAQILATFPISDVHHVEIVYGPASPLYGPDAAMGVINVITRDGAERQAKGELGSSLSTKFTFGGPQRSLGSFGDSTKLADGTFQYITKDFRLRVSTRFYGAVLDRSIGDEYEYTRPSYYSDPRLYGAGALSTYSNMSGQFLSPDQQRAVDARLYVGNTELAAQYFSLSTGLGTRYAADRFQTSTPWTSSEGSIYARHTANLSPSVVSSTLIQYRMSGVGAPSSSLTSSYGLGGTGAASALTGNGNFASVEAPNNAVVVQEDVDVAAGKNLFVSDDALELGVGLKYQHIDFSKTYAYVTNTTYPINAPSVTTAGTSALALGAPVSDGSNMETADAIGAYALGKYSLPHGQAIHLGARIDTPPLAHDVIPTVRGGYVGTFGSLVVKALYGQAVYAPGPYDLSVAEAAGRPSIKPERSQTLEANVEFSFWKLALHGDAWYVDYSDPIVDGRNLAMRRMAGFDLGAHFLLPPIKAWAYYSRYITAQQSSDASGNTEAIGDLAYDKIWGGVTFEKGPLNATLLGRFVGGRDTVPTNPIGHVPAYFTLDANVTVSHIVVTPLWASFRVANMLDSVYYQPGMGTAGAGNVPGFYNGARYVGSQDALNSLLPQPRRAFFLTVGLDL